MNRFRPLLVLAALVAVLALLVADADARSRGSIGSRGTRTHSAPPPTQTAPNTARPMERSMTQPGTSQASAARTAAQPQTGGLFNRPGLMGGLLAGFLGAGLIGLLLGNGMLGGLAGLASFFGLLLQVGLVAMVAWFAWNWWKRRSQPQPAYAGPGGSMMRQGDLEPMRPSTGGLGGGLSGLGGGLGGGLGAAPGAAPAAAGSDEVGLGQGDFDTFERLLGEVQTAFGREDLSALRTRLTPEMLSYFSEQLSSNASRGVENKISDVKLLQGDLAEAWREGDMDYATVAMRYMLTDRTVDRASGRTVEGSDAPLEATEVWTFVRARGGQWLVSAIQQTD